MLQDLIETYVKTHPFDAYTEIRAQQNTSEKVSMLNGDMLANASSAGGGVSARVYKNGVYGFAATPDYTPDAIGETVRLAYENADFLAGRTGAAKPDFPACDPVNVGPAYTRDEKIPRRRITDYLRELDAHIADTYPDLQSRALVYGGLSMEKLLYTSDGTVAHTYTPRAQLYVSMTKLDRAGEPIELTAIFADYGRFDDLFTLPSLLYPRIDEVYRQICDKCEGVTPDAGVKDCILAPALAGMLAHEAVGHTVEADFVLAGSVGGPYLNKQVASELVTLVDFANTALGKPCPIPVFVDDEGVCARDAVLIDHGILRGYMHSRESAMHYGVEPTGNARAFASSDEPLIRMRNTAILPGQSKIEDMIAAVDDGYYFLQTNNGQADATGEFMFGVTCGYEIKNGKLGRAIRDTTISGVAFDMLKTVDMLSDTMEWECSGFCGKKQRIPVGCGGPAVKCKINVGGN